MMGNPQSVFGVCLYAIAKVFGQPVCDVVVFNGIGTVLDDSLSMGCQPERRIAGLGKVKNIHGGIRYFVNFNLIVDNPTDTTVSGANPYLSVLVGFHKVDVIMRKASSGGKVFYLFVVGVNDEESTVSSQIDHIIDAFNISYFLCGDFIAEMPRRKGQ
jgi:hypothetical protein